MRRHRQHIVEQDDPEVNLTPLIDVVFVVLIVFILVAPMLEIDQIDLAPGAEQQTMSALDNNHPITLRVFHNNAIDLNGNRVTVDHLPTLLGDLRKRHPTARPQLIQDSHSNFGTYQQVKNAVEIAGFEQIDIILKPS